MKSCQKLPELTKLAESYQKFAEVAKCCQNVAYDGEFFLQKLAKAPASCQKLANVANKMANLGKGCTQNLTKVDQQWPNLAKMGKMGKKLQCQNMPTIGKSWGRMAKVAKS